MPKQIDVAINRQRPTDKIAKLWAKNWSGLLGGLMAAGWEIEPNTTGAELADILIALVDAANAEEETEDAPDPYMESLAQAYAAFGLDEPPLEPAALRARQRNDRRRRWGLQYPAED